MTVAAIVLAAGRGTRFGASPKMLAGFAGKPLVRCAVEAALDGGAGSTIVVTGHRAGEVSAALDGLAVTIVHNPAFADGLSTSLRAGFASLPADSEAAIILLGDMPLVDCRLVAALLEAWRRGGRPAAIVPTFGGVRGNPVVLSRALASAIETLAGDVGAGPLLRGRSDVVELEIDHVGVSADVDTPEALERLEPGQAKTTPFRIAT